MSPFLSRNSMDKLPVEIHFRLLEILFDQDYMDVIRYGQTCRRYRNIAETWSPYRRLCQSRSYNHTFSESHLHRVDSTAGLMNDLEQPLNEDDLILQDFSSNASPSSGSPSEGAWSDSVANDEPETKWYRLFCSNHERDESMTNGSCRLEGPRAHFGSMSTMQVGQSVSLSLELKRVDFWGQSIRRI